MPFNLYISPGSDTPIFRQVVDQVRLAAATGRLAPGDPLPSVRALAERLLVNPNTVAKAYAELSREGVIDAQPGRGVFIATPREIYTRAERLRRLAPLIDALLNQGLSFGFTPAELLELFQQKLAKIDIPDAPKRKIS